MLLVYSRLCFGLSLLVSSCAAQDLGPTPEISDLTLQSPDPSDTTRVSGSVHVSDPLGLTALMVHVTVEGPMSTVTLPPLTIHTTVEGQLEATVTFGFKSGGDFASGTYAIAVNVTESGIPSNTLTTAMLVE